MCYFLNITLMFISDSQLPSYLWAYYKVSTHVYVYLGINYYFFYKNITFWNVYLSPDKGQIDHSV